MNKIKSLMVGFDITLHVYKPLKKIIKYHHLTKYEFKRMYLDFFKFLDKNENSLKCILHVLHFNTCLNEFEYIYQFCIRLLSIYENDTLDFTLVYQSIKLCFDRILKEMEIR